MSELEDLRAELERLRADRKAELEARGRYGFATGEQLAAANAKIADQAAALARVRDAYAALPRFCCDDEDWSRFADAVRDALAAQPATAPSRFEGHPPFDQPAQFATVSSLACPDCGGPLTPGRLLPDTLRCERCAQPATASCVECAVDVPLSKADTMTVWAELQLRADYPCDRAEERLRGLLRDVQGEHSRALIELSKPLEAAIIDATRETGTAERP